MAGSGLLPAQYDAPVPPGAATGGQLQFGAFTMSVLLQLPSSTVKVILLPVGTPLTVQLFPPVLVAVPADVLNVPALTVTSTDQLSRSGAQLADPFKLMPGNGFTVMVRLAVLAHCPAVGVKV